MPSVTIPAPSNFFNYTVDDLCELFKADFGTHSFRAELIYKWVYQRNIRNTGGMSDLSKSFRQTLGETLCFELPDVTKVLKSSDGSYKFLFQFSDGSEIETVAMNHDGYFSVCVSSQVGCAMGCTFCMTGKMGLKRNLTAAEIVGQVYSVWFYIAEHEEKPLRNIVYMGMGEPFHNYRQVTKSLHILMDDRGFGFGNRRITVSTSGLIPQIERFITEETPNLAISLNAVDPEKRKDLMPISGKYPLDRLIGVCRQYSPRLKKRITFEYIMMKGNNDSIAEAKQLAKLLSGIKAKINLIPYNMNSELGFDRSDEHTLKQFQSYLLAKGYVATIRRSKGQDIGAACGQLIRLKKPA